MSCGILIMVGLNDLQSLKLCITFKKKAKVIGSI